MQMRADQEPNESQRLRASDIGRYLFCARAWWLERVAGYDPTNRNALDRGQKRHQRHGRLMLTGERQVNLARRLFWCASILAVILVLSLLWR